MTLSTPKQDAKTASNSQDFSVKLTVKRSAREVYDAICDVRSWWTGQIDGPTAAVGDEFVYRYEALHESRQRVAELVPGERVVWDVLWGKLTHVGPKDEWKGTRVVFTLHEVDGATEVGFTHEGLVPSLACFNGCSRAWTHYVEESLAARLAPASQAVAEARS